MYFRIGYLLGIYLFQPIIASTSTERGPNWESIAGKDTFKAA